MNIIWIMIAAILGFGISAIFAGWLKLPRNVYLFFYIPLVVVLILAFVIYNDLKIIEIMTHNWHWGLIASTIASFVVIKNVLSQPSSDRNHGLALLSDILWPGIIYGLIDALLLSVLPVLSVKLVFADSELLNGYFGIIAISAIALLASLFVTVAYHLGYPEFRDKKVIRPMIGNGILSFAYLITMNPLAAILPHIAMHIIAMIHGRDTTGQVPPHYIK